MATPPFLPSFIDHPNDLRSEEIVNYNQHKELGASTLSASSLGNADDPNRPIYNIQCPTMFVGNANGLKYMPTNIQAPVSIAGNANALNLPNNIQGLIPIACNTNGLNNNQALMHYPFEPNYQSQDNNGKIPDIYTNSKTGLAAPFREQDQYMPIANVVRIMRRALPQQAKVADEAKELLQGCVSEFISFITSEANENCQLEHRKTITAEDVIRAMSRLGFEHYVQPLSMYLQKYRESETLPTAVPRRMAYFNNDVNAITSTTSVVPPCALVHPQYAMTIATTPSVSVGNGQKLALKIGDGSGGSDGVGPSESPQDGFDFFYTYDKYK